MLEARTTPGTSSGDSETRLRTVGADGQEGAGKPSVGTLPLQERVHLARQAAEIRLHRLEAIARFSDPQDTPVRELLRTLTSQASLGLDRLRRIRTGGMWIEDERAKALLREWIHSAWQRFGEGPLDREVALYLAEALLDECACFLGALSNGTTEPGVRKCLEDVADSCRHHLEHVRRVILPSPPESHKPRTSDD